MFLLRSYVFYAGERAERYKRPKVHINLPRLDKVLKHNNKGLKQWGTFNCTPRLPSSNKLKMMNLNEWIIYWMGKIWSCIQLHSGSSDYRKGTFQYLIIQETCLYIFSKPAYKMMMMLEWLLLLNAATFRAVSFGYGCGNRVSVDNIQKEVGWVVVRLTEITSNTDHTNVKNGH